MNELIMLVGLPGCGKSTIAKHYQEKGYKIFSSDAIRKEIYGDESVQDDPQKIFQILHKRIKENLKNGESCIYDATNIRSKNRIAFLREIQKIECHKKCLVVWAPIEICKKRNAERERNVPDYVIERMWRQFETPYYFEGWDEIEVFYSLSHEESIKVFDNFYDNKEKTFYFNQDNSHHKLTLGEHMSNAADFVDSYGSVITKAALFHDYGKLFTKTFFDKRGNASKDAHYYDHQNVGAYEIFSAYLGMDKKEIIEISALICYHMHPYFWANNPKMEEKYRQLWGEDFYNKILLIHEADVAAH